MNRKKEIIVIVAHPDDETIWAGGAILMGRDCNTTILSLCRGSDADRAPKFQKVVREMKACGVMGDLDDGPEQMPLESRAVCRAVPLCCPVINLIW